MEVIPDSLAADLPPLGSRCAALDCDAVPTHQEALVFDYGHASLVTHTLYVCGAHRREVARP